MGSLLVCEHSTYLPARALALLITPLRCYVSLWAASESGAIELTGLTNLVRKRFTQKVAVEGEALLQ